MAENSGGVRRCFWPLFSRRGWPRAAATNRRYPPAAHRAPALSVKTVDLKQRKIRIYQYGFRKASITDTEDGRRLMNRVAEIEKAFNCVIELPEDDDYTAVWNAPWRDSPASTS